MAAVADPLACTTSGPDNCRRAVRTKNLEPGDLVLLCLANSASADLDGDTRYWGPFFFMDTDGKGIYGTLTGYMFDIGFRITAPSGVRSQDFSIGMKRMEWYQALYTAATGPAGFVRVNGWIAPASVIFPSVEVKLGNDWWRLPTKMFQ